MNSTRDIKQSETFGIGKCYNNAFIYHYSIVLLGYLIDRLLFIYTHILLSCYNCLCFHMHQRLLKTLVELE